MLVKTGKILKIIIIFGLNYGTLIYLPSSCIGPYGIYHTVQSGQTLYRLSKSYNVSVEELMRVNKIEDPASLRVGQKIFIPGADRELDVEPYNQKQEWTEYEERRGKKPPESPHLTGDTNFIWPVRGKLMAVFESNKNRRHDGIDISAPEGTEIRSSAGGRVIYSGSGIRGYGNIIIIKHNNDYFTVYAHNKENHVLEGDYVKQGQVIGRVGKTGRAYGPHLHFELRKGKKPVDPLKLLP